MQRLRYSLLPYAQLLKPLTQTRSVWVRTGPANGIARGRQAQGPLYDNIPSGLVHGKFGKDRMCRKTSGRNPAPTHQEVIRS